MAKLNINLNEFKSYQINPEKVIKIPFKKSTLVLTMMIIPELPQIKDVNKGEKDDSLEHVVSDEDTSADVKKFSKKFFFFLMNHKNQRILEV